MNPKTIINIRERCIALARHATPLPYFLALLCFAVVFLKSRQSCMGSIELFGYWLLTGAVSALLAATAFLLAILSRAAVVVRIAGNLGSAIGIVPICIALWAVLGPDREPFELIILSFLPTLLAAAALLILRNRPRPT
jgi:hypothetical protein